jgi:phage terminase large subunit-like protein
VSAPKEDWRLQGQEAYLTGATLEWRPYTRYSASWEHDHCEFCWAKFAEPEPPSDALHEGYTTTDRYRWICATCFGDFKDRFHWQVALHQAS